MGDAHLIGSAEPVSESHSSSINDDRRGSPAVSLAESCSGIRPGNSVPGIVSDNSDCLQFRNGISTTNGKKKAVGVGRRCKDVGQKWCQKLRGTRHSEDDASLNVITEGMNPMLVSRRSLSSESTAKSDHYDPQQPSGSTAATTSSSLARRVEANRPIVPPLVSPAESAGIHNDSSQPAANRALSGGYSAMFLSSLTSPTNNNARSPGFSAGNVPTSGSSGGQQAKNRPVNPAAARRLIAPSLFPCFKKRVSSDSESDLDATGTSRGTISTGVRPHQQSAANSRELGQRMKASASDEGSAPNGFISHFRAVNGMIAEPYPVHTQIEYTHYLVPDLLEISNASYYWGVMDRFEAERLLEGKPEGSFLLRDSAQSEYLFSVSFRRYGRSLHARIEQSRHRFSFDSHDEGVFSSETVTGLIDHYKNPAVCLFFEPQLSLPLKRNFPFSLQHLCRAVISQTLVRRCEPIASYGAIQSLSLPRSLGEFLEEYHYKHPVRVRKVEHSMASMSIHGH